MVKLPEEVKFNDIPKINDAKSVWRLGMRKIEETFAEHIANMHIDFEDKVVVDKVDVMLLMLIMFSLSPLILF